MIYLDNAAATKVDREVIKAMEPYLSTAYGNPSAMHTLGTQARTALEQARSDLAKIIGALPQEIIFTSCSTESNNLAWFGIAQGRNGGHIITSKIEHPSILKAAKQLEHQGFDISYVDVDGQGIVSSQAIKNAIREDTFLVSIMHANNEMGSVQPIKAIGELCREKNILFHTDAVQSFTKIPFDVHAVNLDLVSLSSHKIHGPRGIAALFVCEGVPLHPQLVGGGHERGLRSGTENVAGAVGFAAAAKLGAATDWTRVALLRDRLIAGIRAIPDVLINGDPANTLPNYVHCSIKGVNGIAVTRHLDKEGVAVSAGSSCSGDILKISNTIKAIGVDDAYASGSLRLTLSKYTTEEEIDLVIERIKRVVSSLRAVL